MRPVVVDRVNTPDGEIPEVRELGRIAESYEQGQQTYNDKDRLLHGLKFVKIVGCPATPSYFPKSNGLL
jgi:hypothetical protein